ncbi:chitin binding peritrophin-A domain-containing protein [Streptomyces sp. NPDC054961]
MIKVSRLAASAFLAVGVLCLPVYAASAQTPTATASADGSPCDGHPHGALIADLDDPATYYQCSWGETYTFHCARGLHFNPRQNICDRPEDAGNPAAGQK